MDSEIKSIYIAPHSEVYELETENAILAGSTESSGESGNWVTD